MSYPRKLHVLVVEDDSDAVEAYRVWFKTVKKTYSFVEPIYVRSFTDAQTRIKGTDIIHAVILDLNLPMETRAVAVEGLAPGEQLLEAIAKRDSHPIPVLLVVSGKLNLAQPLSNIEHRLQNDFWYGRLVNKGPEQYKEIAEGLTQALRYCDVGIHIRDAGKEWYPTLSPREEDILRRCVLAQSSCLGVDLRWWGAENGPSYSHPTPDAGPTKVLMGHFLLDDGLGSSLPTFFKIEPSGNGPFVCRDAAILAHKLGHVKVIYTLQSRDRSLIVTQSVTNQGWPISFNEYLSGESSIVGRSLASLIDSVVHQLDQLGVREEDDASVGAFLWEYLDRPAMEKTWNACDTRQLQEDGFPDPLATYDHLKQSTAKHWAARRRCTHGDLNATNVAIDGTNPDAPQAYIFDAAGMRTDFEYRDLATLEVTMILFNSASTGELLASSQVFYADGFIPNLIERAASDFARNVLSTIQAIRARFQDDGAKTAYALLLFSAAMQQLSGLGFQPSPNKVRNPLHACYLAAWIAKWLKALVPQLFPDTLLPINSSQVSAIASNRNR
jgi:CheY-like chemotaxis protein